MINKKLLQKMKLFNRIFCRKKKNIKIDIWNGKINIILANMTIITNRLTTTSLSIDMYRLSINLDRHIKQNL